MIPHSQPETLIKFKRRESNFQSNLITESRHEFTEAEKKIFVLVINQLKQLPENQLNHNLRFKIPMTELTSTNHSDYHKAVDNITTRRLTSQDLSNPQRPKYLYIVPFPIAKVDYESDGKAYIEVTMLGEIVPYFIELGNRYTKYNLEVMLSLGSIYTQRLYEIIMLYYNRGQAQFTYTISKLKFLLNCPDSYTFNEIRKRALVPAQQELSEKANIQFEWEPTEKEGKKIIELKIIIKSAVIVALEKVEEEMSSFAVAKPDTVREVAVQLLQSQYSFSTSQVNTILSTPEILRLFVETNAKIEQGLIKIKASPTQYMASILGFGRKA